MLKFPLITGAALLALAGPAAAAPSLTAAPASIKAGQTVELKGRAFAGGSQLTIFAIVDGQRSKVGWAHADPWGRFRAPVRTAAGTLPGDFRFVACRKGSCAAESARSRVVKIR
jgi:hypothetical protein